MSEVQLDQAPYLPRKTRMSRLTVYRCLGCEDIYNLYSATRSSRRNIYAPPRWFCSCEG
jgi:hypothetical protein